MALWEGRCCPKGGEHTAATLYCYMIKAIKLSPFIKDVGLTAITSVVTILSIIIVMRVLAHGLGAEGFGAYSLARQFLSTIIPFSTLAMGVAIPRYIAISKDDHCRFSYLLNGLFLVVILGFVTLITGLIFKNELTVLIFHNKVYSSLFVATLFMLVGYSLYSILYAFYRGLGKMGKANLWQLGIMAIGPIVIALGYAKSGRVDFIVFLMGLMSFTALVPLSFFTYRAISQNKQIFKVKGRLKELLGYGLPRVPGGFAFAGILAIGPFLAPYFGSLKDAGYLVAGQSLFRIVEGGIGAFGLVALPKVAQLFAKGKNEFLKERITDLITLIFHLGLFATLHLILWSDQIVLVWLGNQYAEAIPLIRILLLALIPYLAFTMLCSIIDAVQKRAVNTLNLYMSFIITLVSSLLFAKMGFGVIGMAIGTTMGFITLGLFTTCYLWRAYRLNDKTIIIKQCLLANTGFIACAFVLKYWFEMTFSGITLISIATPMEGLFLSLYCFTLWKLNARWIVELKNRIVKVSPSEL